MNNGYCNITDPSSTCTDCYFQCTRKQVAKVKRNERQSKIVKNSHRAIERNNKMEILKKYTKFLFF